ncbi:hypothetical protein TNCV_2904891 [Trichonephila clavipes]|nr:hypothetical protein TNCV_2904891 [Trichonephila clavipes]
MPPRAGARLAPPSAGPDAPQQTGSSKKSKFLQLFAERDRISSKGMGPSSCSMAIVVKPFSRSSVVVERKNSLINFNLNIRINETFLGFIVAVNQTAKSLESDVLNFLNTLDINLAKCRGQGYDGAANMSGARILTSIENLRNNFANIKEEAIGLAKKWGITSEFEKKEI